MSRLLVLVAGLAVVSTVAHNTHSEDDFAFDNNDEFQIDTSGSTEAVDSSKSLRRLWGVPDTSAYVGRLFRLEIPKEAFSGKVSAYKVTGLNKQPLPSWLALDSKHGILTGVAAHSDVGSHVLTVSAYGQVREHKAEDTFTVEVRRDVEKPLIASDGSRCLAGEDELILVILLDRPFHHLKPKQKIKALMSLSSFMGIDGEAFSIDAFKLHDSSNSNYSLFLSGPGNAKKTHNEHSSAIYLNVGCSGHLWPKHKILVHQLREQARDGSMSDLIHLPVLAWRVMKKTHKRDPRLKRQAEDGSGVYDDDYDVDDEYSGYDEENDDGEGGEDFDDFVPDDATSEVDPAIPLPRTTSSTAAPTTIPTTPSTPITTNLHHITTPHHTTTPRHTTTPPHPHRHHHGEPNYPDTSREDLTDSFSNTESDVFVAPEATPETPIVQTTIESVNNVTTPNILLVTYPTTAKIRTTESLTEMLTQIPIESNEYQLNKNDKPDKVTLTADTLDPTNPPTHSTSNQRPSEDTTPLATAITTNAIVEKDSPVGIVPVDNKTDVENVFRESRYNGLQNKSPIQIVPEESTLSAVTIQSTLLIEPSNLPSEAATVTPRLVNVTKATEKPSPPPTLPTESPMPASTRPLAPTSAPTSPTQLVETYAEEKTTTEQEAIQPTEKSSTIVGRTTETVEFSFPINSAPTLNHRMKKIAVTAGKAFRYIIPEDLFTDLEDGTSLSLRMYDSDKSALSSDSWVQFLPGAREVYGLPLEEHVSKWEYIVEASDSKGATAVDRLDITVQQHKGRRAVNHEFSIKMKVVQKYVAAVNWQIRALEGLVSLFRDTDMDQITVREVNRDNELVEFIWTNDTLPKSECPTKEIDRLLNILRTDESGSPSTALSDAMAPELKARWAGWRALGVCQAPAAPPTAPPAAPAPPKQPDNYPPVPRNQVDHIHAVVGHLLVFKVPEDTFFDPEDGGARNLKLRLVQGDRSPVPTQHWLQFDSNNQEFYGLPIERDIGRKDYQLIAEDSDGKTANDGLIVEVVAAPTIRPNVEFSVTLASSLASLVSSAKVKRRLLQKMHQLFYDEDASSIRVKSITDNPTTVTWYNTSLPMDRCPKEEIQQLRNIIVREDGSLTSRVDEIMGTEFPVMSVSLTTQGVCLGQDTVVYKLDTPRTSNTEETKATLGKVDDYLITFIIPAVVVVCMIIVAGIIACVLYRRRKTGKMSLGDEEERQAFRSKGIPVIFQDELDEKPDPSNKSPVIMKEEKPPLLPPPSYGGSDSPAPSPRAPYHPPPPFPPNRESARNSRPKATPTYRKPPPYVPP